MYFGGDSYSVLIVSGSEKFAQSLRTLLQEGLYEPVAHVTGLSSAKRELLERSYDFVLINSPLPEDPGVRLAVDVCQGDSSVALLFVPSESYVDLQERMVTHGVFVLQKPVSRPILELALQWMRAARQRLGTASRKTATVEEKIQEIRLVNRAKWLLIGQLGMSEEEAHRYIEKQAMDRCVSKQEIAESILRTYA